MSDLFLRSFKAVFQLKWEDDHGLNGDGRGLLRRCFGTSAVIEELLEQT